jgi:hypothetical protein
MPKKGKKMSRKVKEKKNRCYYCNQIVNLKELLKVDELLKNIESEEHEFLLDKLPKSSHTRGHPYIHVSDLGYKVLNICFSCFSRVKKGGNY